VPCCALASRRFLLHACIYPLRQEGAAREGPFELVLLSAEPLDDVYCEELPAQSAFPSAAFLLAPSARMPVRLLVPVLSFSPFFLRLPPPWHSFYLTPAAQHRLSGRSACLIWHGISAALTSFAWARSRIFATRRPARLSLSGAWKGYEPGGSALSFANPQFLLRLPHGITHAQVAPPSALSPPHPLLFR